MKRGQINTGFQTRYFVLRGGKLSYFEAPKDTTPKGTIDVRVAKLHVDASNELKIAVPGRVYIIRGQTNAERDEWMRALVLHGAVILNDHNKTC
jgi:hypothetical protein